MADYAKLLEVGREAVAAACSVTRQVQDALDQVRSITKDDKSPVTVADYASQAIVGRILREHFGEHVVLVAEEGSAFLRDEDNAVFLQATLAAVKEVWPEADEDAMLDVIDLGSGDAHHRGFWTLDPIDGTKGFLRNQQYAIALAYVEGDTPTVGVMGCPNLPVDMSEPLDVPDPAGCMYLAIKGEGVYETAADDAGAALTRITRLDHMEDDPISVCASVEKAHSNVDDTDRVLEHIERAHGIPVGEPTRLDSQAKYAVVARGQADAYIRLPTRAGYVERIWDHAAGACIASEAGAFVTDMRGHSLDFSHGRGLEKNKGIICAPPRVHAWVIEAIKALGIAPAE
ncbi:MAG: 3'(2'),5'-bisphosphate nucleotidase [Phycisphaerales bacterium]